MDSMEKMADEVVRGTKALLEKELAPLRKRLDEIEAGLSRKADIEELGRSVDAISEKSESITKEFAESISSLAAKIDEIPHGPQGEPGKDGRDGVDGAKGEPGKDGKDGADVVSGLIDGKGHLVLTLSNGTTKDVGLVMGRDGKDGVDGKDGADGHDGADGKDGAGITEAMVSKDGHLVLTFSNGATKDVGTVVGRDGKDGIDGQKGEPGIDGKDGAPGKDGRDGIRPEEFDFKYDGERTFKFVWDGGSEAVTRDFVVPFQIYQGTFSEGREYKRGDQVTYGGSQWTAMEDTSEKPGSGPTAWQLSTKKGRDGKDGQMKPAPSAKPVKV